jgi:hypothetical protein
MDSGAWPRATVWVGGHIHSWHRLLLDTEAEKAETVCTLVGMAYVGALDCWRDRPLVLEYLSVALAANTCSQPFTNSAILHAMALVIVLPLPATI